MDTPTLKYAVGTLICVVKTLRSSPRVDTMTCDKPQSTDRLSSHAPQASDEEFL